MECVIRRIRREVKPIYLSSPHYKLFIWRHAQRVAQYAKDFAGKMQGDKFVAEAGGLLHDVGAAKYGKENHHITGAQEAGPILLKCGCPLPLIGPIISAVYSHRGSQRIAFQTIEAKCVAAADAIEHFGNLEELWRVQVEDRGILEVAVYQTLAEKLARDWDKIEPEIKAILDGEYEHAKQKLLEIASKKRKT
ncbi:MAG: HD domain-containing protein [Candidatus Staskawiczbacteria bacterium]|nr:HD domain-containing protein [Candidatus Staskawiczbacteria bacterium]